MEGIFKTRARKFAAAAFPFFVAATICFITSAWQESQQSIDHWAGTGAALGGFGFLLIMAAGFCDMGDY